MNNKIIELGNFMLSINNDESKKVFINGSIINHPDKNLLIKLFRQENNNENKSVVEKDENGNEIIVHKYSQIKEWNEVFGLKDTEENYNKLKKYLNELLVYKNN